MIRVRVGDGRLDAFAQGRAEYDDTMKLWTWHTPDFFLLKGRVDHNRSEYYQTVEGVPDAYSKLFELIGTSQFVWCYTVPDQRIVLPCHTQVERILDVPRESILRFVDGIVWNRILGIRCELPSEIWHTWRDEALHRFPEDRAARKRFRDEQEEVFWAQQPPGESWWDTLFTPNGPGENVSALVRHPVPKAWVVVDPIHER